MSTTKTLTILILLLVASLGASVYTAGFAEIPLLRSGGGTLSAEEAEMAKGKAVEFINAALVQPGTEVVVGEVTEEQGLYKMTIAVAGREVTSYMSKDFSTFFPSPMEMGAVAGAEVDAPAGEVAPTQDIPKSAEPEVYLFSMAFCPHGTQAEDLMKPVAELLGDTAEIEVHYVLYENYQGGGPSYCIDAESKYCAMHGVGEVHQGIRELCVEKYQPGKLWDFVSAVNKRATPPDGDVTAGNIDTKWEDIARGVGVDTSKIKSCQAGEFQSLLDAEVALTKAIYPVQNPARHLDEGDNPQERVNIMGSPTLVINGMIYDGDRTSEGYKQAICGAFETAPEVCTQVLGEGTSPAAAGDCGD